MKTILALAVALSFVGGSVVNAASLSVSKTGDAFSVLLNGEATNGNFDTIFFKANPTAPATFTNTNGGLVAGAPRPAGQAFTYPNRFLNADPGDFPEGLGLSQFGLVNTAAELSFTVASLGGTISTATQNGGLLFLGNLNMPGAASAGAATVQLLRGGQLVQELRADLGFVIPEPATFAMAGLGLIGIVAAARRKA